MRPSLFLAPLLGALLSLQPAAAQTVVNSTFLGQSTGLYSDPNEWVPSEVPNNTETRHYNVTVPNRHVSVDIDATISNLTFQGFATVLNTTLTVAGTSLIDDESHIGVVSFGGSPATFNVGTLSAFSNNTLRGAYGVSAAESPATLQFRGANIVTLEGELSLYGPLARVADEFGNDGLRNFTLIESSATLTLDGRNLTTFEPFTNRGTLNLGTAGLSTIFTAANALTNFDAATRTLAGGEFMIGASFDQEAVLPAELRFNGADIVNNGSKLVISGATARIADLAGNDGLRNLARNLPGASLSLRAHNLVTTRFQNDGSLTLDGSIFTVAGSFNNFDPSTRTLSGGAFEITAGGNLKFNGADIVHNGASIFLHFGGSFTDLAGNNGLRNFSDNLAGGFFTLGQGQEFKASSNFTNAGRIETIPYFGGIPENPPAYGSFVVPSGFAYTQTGGTTVNGGRLTADPVNIFGGSLSGSGLITGNVIVTDGTISPTAIDGDLTLHSGSQLHYVVSPDQNPLGAMVTGKVVLAGTLEIKIEAENFLSSEAELTVLRSDGPMTGVFANAPEGTRITTLEGSGSFVVRYETNAITLTGFRANPPPAQLLNISSRSYIRPPDDFFIERVIIGGFIISGVEAKTVVIRGLAPSLVQAGVSSTLNDPTLGLYSADGNVIVANDNWRETQQAEIATAGLAPVDDREAAIHVTLSPGAYTAVLRDKNDEGGNGLVEIYDLSPGVNSKLGNISTLGFVDPDNVLIGGIITGGEGQGNSEIVVRALGPQLKRSNGVFSALEDPTLELRDSNGSVLAFSDGGANSYGPTLPVPREFRLFFSTEEAIRVSLPRGRYTAIVRAKDGNRGTALVEFYDLRR